MTLVERGRVHVVGGSGHAKVCIDILMELGHSVAGVVDVEPPSDAPVPYLGDDDWLTQRLGVGPVPVLVAVGANALRARLQSRFAAAGADLITAVSPGALLSPSVRIGEGSVVMPGAIINADAVIGRGVIVNTGATLDHDTVVGDWAHIAPGCHVAGNVHVGEGAFLGIGVSVVPQRSIGKWATVGAGAAVVHDVEDGATDVGVPNHRVR